jgi:hypothetical protein
MIPAMKSASAALLSVCILLMCIGEAHAYHASGVVVYPVPYYAGRGVFQAVDLTGTAFQRVRLKIYNIVGEQVYSGIYPGYPVIWNGRDDGGDRVDPGVYTVRLEADNIFTGLHATKTVNILTSGGSRGTFTRGGWIGAKYVAMGRSGEVIADDLYSIYWNPAGLTELRHTRLMTAKEIKEKAEKGKVQDITESDLVKFSEEEKSFSVQFGATGSLLAFGNKTLFAGMAINLPKGVLGIGVYTIYSGGIDRRDFSGFKTGDLQYIGSALYLSYGVSLGISSFGVSIKGLYEKIGNNTYMGAGADVGTQVFVLPFLKVGLMIQDVGTGMYPMNTDYGTPHRYNFGYPTLRLGIAIITNRNFTLNVSGIKKLDQKEFGYSVGARYDIVKWASVYIGMQNLVFSAGLTFHVVQFDASYAFTLDTVNKGFNHIVSASVMF